MKSKVYLLTTEEWLICVCNSCFHSVCTFLSSCLLSKDQKIEVQNSIILGIALNVNHLQRKDRCEGV